MSDRAEKAQIKPHSQGKDRDDSRVMVFKYQKLFNKHLFYPMNELAERMVKFRGRKNLTDKEVEFLKSIGFELDITVEQIKVPEGLI